VAWSRFAVLDEGEPVSEGHVPPVFVSHGAPSLAVDAARGSELGQWAGGLPRPRAILAISAHWTAPSLSRGSTASRPELIRDFDDYPAALPPELDRVEYAPPGAPDLAYELHSLLPVERVQKRGFDHGVWGPLVHMFPNADIPVLQLSLVLGATPRSLFAIGRKIGVLASRGVLLMGSGGITHSLAELDPRADVPPTDAARTFDGWVANLLADAELDELLQWRAKAPNARHAHPTPEHLDPLFIIAGAASLYDHSVGFPIRGFEHGTMSRRCIQFGR
jgi:4,5-DOPA dioxygenase extradiol